jgi:putative membrane protein
MIVTRFDGTYCGPPPDPAVWWSYWNFDPPLLLALGLLAVLMRRKPAGWAAVLVLCLVFVTPLCALTVALFSARVLHHILLVVVAAPLLAWAWPARRTVSPALGFVAATGVLWLWHLPAAYDLAQGNTLVYWVMQGSLLGSAIVLWRAILHPDQPAASAILFIFAGFVQMALLGALLTLAPAQLYAIHAVAPMDWGLTPLADQQLGGLIMWMPAGIPYLVIGAVVARRGWRGMENLT